jgi:hypothetical protein
MLAAKIQPGHREHLMDAGRRWILPISEGMTETVHTDTRQLRPGTVMLKSEDGSPFRLNKARLGQSLV